MLAAVLLERDAEVHLGDEKALGKNGT